MKRNTLIGLAIAAVVIFIIGGSLMGAYNGLVIEKENVSAKLKGIDTQLQRRADLIPNLVSSVKGYTDQEKAIINSITDARKTIAGAGKTEDKIAASDQLTSTIRSINLNIENYPNLKSDANFRQLMDELAGTENRIQISRKDYNDGVQIYNSHLKSFPTSIIAGMFGFKDASYFEASAASKEVPKADFSSSK